MNFKKIVFLLVLTVLFSCSEDSDSTVPRNLQEYVADNNNVMEQGVLAFAANADANTALTYIYYYPEDGAVDFRYYELTDNTLEKDNFVNYRRQSLESRPDFGAKLQRFSRTGDSETWCLVTYKKEGILHISNPIKLNNTSKSTKYLDAVVINYRTTIEPNFTWDDTASNNSVKYLQLLTDVEDNFISGTFTENTFFQYYNTDNVTLNLNKEIPKALVADQVYNFSMFGVGADNWVELVIKEQFIPRNLEEYVAVNAEKEREVALAFAGNANGNKEETYIYFYPITGGFDYRYYETENTNVSPTVFSNYKRRVLPETPQFGGKFRRFSRASSDAVWCLVTYIADGKLYISKPIKTKNTTKTTEWSVAVDITFTETLKPIFTWEDGIHQENESYLQIFTDDKDVFLTGTYTNEKTFQYYNEANIISKIHTEVPPALILDATYKFNVFGLSTDNWLNLVIQKSFIAQ